jgi:stage V sporulation protein B
MSSYSKQQFLDGAMALTVSTVIVKIIGLVYKIPLMRILGAEGMGYFNSAYEMYTLFFVISTAGIPVAISIMISKSIAAGRLKNAEKTYRLSLWLLLLVGTVGSLVMVFGANAIARSIKSPGAALSLTFVAPTVLFISISGAVRGYFQGCRNMVPTAVSQVAESLGKLVLGLAFAYVACSRGLSTEKVAAFAILGLTVGTAISTLYLCIARAHSGLTLEHAVLENTCDGAKTTLSRLVKLAVPVTVSSVLVSLTRIVDMSMLMNRLQGSSETLAIYGSYSTMALPIYNLPSSLVAGIALALVPSITNAVQLKQSERESQLIASGFKLCALIAFPAALGIGVYSEQILGLLFFGETEAISVSSPLLSMLATSVFASCLVQVGNSVLQAKGKILHPIISMLVGMLVKTVSAYVLIGIPNIGAMGAPISTLFCNITVVVMELWFIEKHTCFDVRLGKAFGKPAVFSSLAIVFSVAVYLLGVYFGISERISFVLAAAFCGVVYALSVILGGALDMEEFEMLPLGNKLYNLCERLNVGTCRNNKN